MAALTAARNFTAKMSERVLPDLLYVPVEANVWCHQGGMIVRDAAGYVRPGRTALGDIALGAMETMEGPGTVGTGGNNTGGAAGAISIHVRQGVHNWANSAAGDAITQQNVGQVCYIVDDQTVALTDGNGTRSPAGIIQLVDGSGVWVLQGIWAPPVGVSNNPLSNPMVVGFVVDLADITATDIVVKWQPGFAGRIVKFEATVSKIATTAAKLATLTPQINPALGADVAVTGGALALTSANMTPLGATVQSAAITGANTFAAGDGISILASAVTAFVEGRVLLTLTLA